MDRAWCACVCVCVCALHGQWKNLVKTRGSGLGHRGEENAEELLDGG